MPGVLSAPGRDVRSRMVSLPAQGHQVAPRLRAQWDATQRTGGVRAAAQILGKSATDNRAFMPVTGHPGAASVGGSLAGQPGTAREERTTALC